MRTKMLFVVVLVAMFGCAEVPEEKFHKGEIVVVRLTGERVMVIDTDIFIPNTRKYGCRVSAPMQVKRDGIFSKDTSITRHAVVWFSDFELEREE